MLFLTNLAGIVVIAATVFVALTLLLPALELRHLTDTFMSLYMQLLAVVSLSALRIDKVDFGVYKEDPLVA